MAIERETLEVDVLVVGAGPAGLAAAYQARKRLREAGREDAAVAVLEKGRQVGAHVISGAVMDPRGLAELLPEWRELDPPIESPVIRDDVYFLTRRSRLRLPLTPPPLRNHGNYLVSLNRFIRWLGPIVEASGVDVFPGFSGADLLFEDDRLAGVRTGDKGVDRRGEPKENFEPGLDVRAQVTILAEGVRGSLTKRLIRRCALDAGRNPQVYAVGIKEVWEVPGSGAERGRVIHTLGFPLARSEFGGGFVYYMSADRVAVGLVAGLDYRNPRFDPHDRFREFKQHPLLRRTLAGGRLVSSGAKAIPEGGWWARPRAHVAGGLIVGDAAGLLDSMRLKGVHLALGSGRAAGDVAAEAVLAGDVTAERLRVYEDRIEQGWIGRDLWRVRNFHQGFDRGLWAGLAHAALQMATGGRGLRGRYPNAPGHERMRRLDETADDGARVSRDGWRRELDADKLSDVHHSGTAHDEDQPVHLVVLEPTICTDRCTREYGNPCQRFCPAAVYEMLNAGAADARLQINASNCVHCKTCDIMDPYQIIDWVPPEGGGGPDYQHQ